MRLLTWNILGMRGFCLGEEPSSNPGPKRPQIVHEMAAALAPLQADIICLQEAADEAQTQQLANALHMHCFYCPAGWKGNESWLGGFPGAILSRLDLHEQCDLRARYCQDKDQDCFIRHWAAARINAINIHTLHLAVRDPDKRLRELDILLRHCSGSSSGPEITNTIILGDCNFEATGPEHARMRANGFIDSFTQAAKADAFPLSCPSINPSIRIDYIWLSKDLSKRLSSCSILNQAPFGPRQSDGLALSDHLPVLIELDDPVAYI